MPTINKYLYYIFSQKNILRTLKNILRTSKNILRTSKNILRTLNNILRTSKIHYTNFFNIRTTFLQALCLDEFHRAGLTQTSKTVHKIHYTQFLFIRTTFFWSESETLRFVMSSLTFSTFYLNVVGFIKKRDLESRFAKNVFLIKNECSKKC